MATNYYTVKKNDTWESIATQYDLDSTILSQANKDFSSLTPGTVLKLPKIGDYGFTESAGIGGGTIPPVPPWQQTVMQNMPWNWQPSYNPVWWGYQSPFPNAPGGPASNPAWAAFAGMTAPPATWNPNYGMTWNPTVPNTGVSNPWDTTDQYSYNAPTVPGTPIVDPYSGIPQGAWAGDYIPTPPTPGTPAEAASQEAKIQAALSAPYGEVAKDMIYTWEDMVDMYSLTLGEDGNYYDAGGRLFSKEQLVIAAENYQSPTGTTDTGTTDYHAKAADEWQALQNRLYFDSPYTGTPGTTSSDMYANLGRWSLNPYSGKAQYNVPRARTQAANRAAAADTKRKNNQAWVDALMDQAGYTASQAWQHVLGTDQQQGGPNSGQPNGQKKSGAAGHAAQSYGGFPFGGYGGSRRPYRTRGYNPNYHGLINWRI